MRLGEELPGSARHAVMLINVYTAILQIVVDRLAFVKELPPQIVRKLVKSRNF